MIGSHIDTQEQQCCKITYGSVQLYWNKSRVSNLIPLMGIDQHTTDTIKRRHKTKKTLCRIRNQCADEFQHRSCTYAK